MSTTPKVQQILRAKWEKPEATPIDAGYGLGSPVFLFNAPGGFPPWEIRQNVSEVDTARINQRVLQTIQETARKLGCSHVGLVETFGKREAITPVDLENLPAEMSRIEREDRFAPTRALAFGFTPEAKLAFDQIQKERGAPITVPPALYRGESFNRREQAQREIEDYLRREIGTVNGPDGLPMEPHRISPATLTQREMHYVMLESRNRLVRRQADAILAETVHGPMPVEFAQALAYEELLARRFQDEYVANVQIPPTTKELLDLAASDLEEAEGQASLIAAEMRSESAMFGDASPGSADSLNAAREGARELRQNYQTLLAKYQAEQGLTAPSSKDADKARAREASQGLSRDAEPVPF